MTSPKSTNSARKIIQICGTNGVGKTTLVKRLLNSKCFEKRSINVLGQSREYWHYGGIIVVGKYNQANCCGVDAGNYSVDGMLATVKRIIELAMPSTLLFEDVRFGASFTFKRRMSEMLSLYNYRYVLLTLVAPAQCSCNRVLNRSGNLGAGYDVMIQKAKCVIKSSKRAPEIGAESFFVDTSIISPQELMGKLMELVNS